MKLTKKNKILLFFIFLLVFVNGFYLYFFNLALSFTTTKQEALSVVTTYSAWFFIMWIIYFAVFALSLVDVPGCEPDS